MNKKSLKETVILSLKDLKKLSNSKEVYAQIIKKKYYDFGAGKTPVSSVSAELGDLIRKGDTRVRRIKGPSGTFLYYLTADEDLLDLADSNEAASKKAAKNKSYNERALHPLLSSYLKSTEIYSKTILHEKSKNSKDNHQKWIHPDMVGIKFLNLRNKASQSLLKAVNRADTFKLSSYELKKEINTDYELKKCFFQAVSNSSWANFGYLVAFEISDNLQEEMERLNQSFGIGILELKANPFESKVLFPARYREIDFKTLDKLCKINPEFEAFIAQTEKVLTALEKYEKLTKKELVEFCDDYFNTDEDSAIKKYCEKHHLIDKETE